MTWKIPIFNLKGLWSCWYGL